MTAILGISALYHDSAAALVVDGKIVAAAQEERFTRQKHDSAFPTEAIAYCLGEAGLATGDIDYVGFYEKPLLHFERLLETYLAFAPRGFRSFLQAMPPWMREKLHIPRLIRRQLGKEFSKAVIFAEHHESHAASAFYPSPFEEAAIVTMDGVGEWATATIGHGKGNRFDLLREIRFPHSLGLLYSAMTYFTGFKVNSGEYKLMGLAPYGEPVYADVIRDKLIDVRDDGSFRLHLEYFNYCAGLTMTSKRMDALFGGPPRKPESPLTQREMDIAASIQKVTDEVMMKTANFACELTGTTNLVLAGGVALNCVANGRIIRETAVKDLWVQPAAGDAGGALGVALLIWHKLLDKPRPLSSEYDLQYGTLLGPKFSTESISEQLSAVGANFSVTDDRDELYRQIAQGIAAGKVVGLMQGRMEFGPRALGSRSILGDPRSPKMQSVMNLKIKYRESFRPFAPSVLHERAAEWFSIDPSHASPYMTLIAPVQEDKRLQGVDSALQGLDRLSELRSSIPAVTHVDYSARLQTVNSSGHPEFHKLLREFESQTGCPILINTSFNVRGEPIVCSPMDAYRCFLATEMDMLVMEDVILLKEKQPLEHVRTTSEAHHFALD